MLVQLNRNPKLECVPLIRSFILIIVLGISRFAIMLLLIHNSWQILALWQIEKSAIHRSFQYLVYRIIMSKYICVHMCFTLWNKIKSSPSYRICLQSKSITTLKKIKGPLFFQLLFCLLLLPMYQFFIFHFLIHQIWFKDVYSVNGCTLNASQPPPPPQPLSPPTQEKKTL